MSFSLQCLIEVNQVTVNIIKQVVAKSCIRKYGTATNEWFY
ncbi:hypothetical protein CDS [Salmonella enterica subsp. enterica serovar Derby]|nr:hypothetical protein CDS [Salmonella enterica subsp. enterica serovar Derby]